MSHHQHHGLEHDTQVSRSLSVRPSPSHHTSMPAISEDELLADPDEPPDPNVRLSWPKHVFPNQIPRRQSLLTRALHTDSESHDDDHFSSSDLYKKTPSVSSTYSLRSTDLTSDDGHASPSTRPSTPGSPHSFANMSKYHVALTDSFSIDSTASSAESKPAQPDAHQPVSQAPNHKEAAVEATLGRKRCVMFACGRNKAQSTAPPSVPNPNEAAAQEPAPPSILKRPCTIKFACLTKPSAQARDADKSRVAARHLSPAPTPGLVAKTMQRRHRDSDTTIRHQSPNPSMTLAIAGAGRTPRSPRSNAHTPDSPGADGYIFHEFAGEEEEPDEWTRVSTAHKKPLTVSDTLKKENDIRRLAEEADEEEAMEEEMGFDDADDDDDDDLLSNSDVSDTGFQTDDEDGFAASDDESDGSDSDYEWWVPRKSRARSPYVGHGTHFRSLSRTTSNSSLDSNRSPHSRGRARHGNKRTLPVQIRPGTPELPDSTDFVCGTLDEDRPLEDAFLSRLEQRKSAKHRACPQDIDPSFPLSDPEIGSDDDDDNNNAVAAADDSDHIFIHGRPDDLIDGEAEEEEEEVRGRRMTVPDVEIMALSPQRLKSPPPKGKKLCAQHRSPAPVKSIFTLPMRRQLRSPVHAVRLSSPPPSRRTSATASPAESGLPFFASRGHDLTHTASLPRSPHPLLRRRGPSISTVTPGNGDDEDEANASDRTVGVGNGRYTRGAIDIAQGLERKRLKRREKFYQKYLRKEEKKERKGLKRPVPGKGAQRMRQIGIDNAMYRGKRMLSI